MTCCCSRTTRALRGSAGARAAAAAGSRTLEDAPSTTGLIVQNEGIIPAVLSVLRTTGRTVPEDVSIVALCPDQVAEQTSPHLSSVTIPAEEMGRRAVELVMQRLDNGRVGEVVLLPPVLTARASSARAPLGR